MALAAAIATRAKLVEREGTLDGAPEQAAAVEKGEAPLRAPVNESINTEGPRGPSQQRAKIVELT